MYVSEVERFSVSASRSFIFLPQATTGVVKYRPRCPELYGRHGLMNKLELWNSIESRLDSSYPKWRERIEGMGQVEAIKKRISGATWSDEEVFEASLMSLLSSNTDWSKIEKIRPGLRDLFSGFSLETYATLQDAKIENDFIPWFKNRKASSRERKKNLLYLRSTALKLLEHSRKHGSAEHYFTSLAHECGNDPKQMALQLGRIGGKYKLKGFGVPLAAEMLKNLGFDVAKPDIHVLRAVESLGLVSFWTSARQSESELLQTMTAVEDIASAAGKYISFVDNAIWLLCAKSGSHLTNEELKKLVPEKQ